MSKSVYNLTSESVTEGHPDKVCDQISDAVLDYILAHDEKPETARVAVETLVTTGTCLVAGEVTTNCYCPVEHVVRDTLEGIGYTRAKYGFDAETVGVLTAIHEQSGDIAQGVDTGGAGDQGMMFGYATNETPEYMPTPIVLAHKLAKRLADVRRSGALDYLRPDGKSQVTVRYEDDRPVAVTKVLIAAQHKRGMKNEEMRPNIIEQVVDPIIPRDLCPDGDPEILFNRTGKFEIGGPQADSGVTGRKIIVDTYGGVARHGGGAFSGKDATKVDRSGAYMVRYIAKNIVAAGLAEKCELQVAYAIGDPEPFSIAVFTFGTGVIPEQRIAEIVEDQFDLSPRGMIEHLQLLRPIFQKTAAYGHFGRDEPEFTWEKVDCVDQLKEAAGI